MGAVVRGALTYLFVWLIFRLSGKRSLSDMTTFDFALLLILSETTQAAMLANDHSMTNSFLLITTLVGLDILISWAKQRFPVVDKVIEGTPLVIVADGIPLRERMDRERVDEGDILASARQLRGLERLDQIKYAVLERNGGITIIPK
jgi:uncharacterized membrane protein YcaP (DUF421 family)